MTVCTLYIANLTYKMNVMLDIRATRTCTPLYCVHGSYENIAHVQVLVRYFKGNIIDFSDVTYVYS